jgi:hypothetical protein
MLLVLWHYDPLLLVKVEKWMGRKVKGGIWEAIKLYSQITKKNELKKDGYHVDSVFLYDKDTENHIIRQYDMLRIFRDLIREEKLGHGKEMGLLDFIELCCNPYSNFQQVNHNSEYVLEVNYTFDYNQYTIFYDTRENSTIQFPIYNESTIHNRDISEGGIIDAMVTKTADEDSGIDITDEIKKLAGPMENFYDDAVIKVPKKWLVDQSIVPKNAFIKIIKFNGDEVVFGPQDEYLTFKN